ncbi:unnamed protein product [Brassica oleracea]|uniref:(rape) hypothetical protein n=1 Tax=Brassica napus TaxID=3708 RepID=A0A816US03_BRANA|nr:unnamed protein product [Brassica napus]
MNLCFIAENREDDVSPRDFSQQIGSPVAVEYYSRPNKIAFIRHRLCGSPEFVDKILVVKRIVVKKIVL